MKKRSRTRELIKEAFKRGYKKAINEVAGREDIGSDYLARTNYTKNADSGDGFDPYETIKTEGILLRCYVGYPPDIIRLGEDRHEIWQNMINVVCEIKREEITIYKNGETIKVLDIKDVQRKGWARNGNWGRLSMCYNWYVIVAQDFVLLIANQYEQHHYTHEHEIQLELAKIAEKNDGCIDIK